MRTLATFVVASCTVAAIAQDGVAPIHQRIGLFAGDSKRALDAMDPTTGTEETCAQYALIETTAKALARELRGEKPCSQYPIADLILAQALTYSHQGDCSGANAYYTTVATMAYTNAILANAPPTGYNTLMEVSDLARFTEKAKTVERLARRHRTLAKHMGDLEELMAGR